MTFSFYKVFFPLPLLGSQTLNIIYWLLYYLHLLWANSSVKSWVCWLSLLVFFKCFRTFVCKTIFKRNNSVYFLSLHFSKPRASGPSSQTGLPTGSWGFPVLGAIRDVLDAVNESRWYIAQVPITRPASASLHHPSRVLSNESDARPPLLEEPFWFWIPGHFCLFPGEQVWGL